MSKILDPNHELDRVLLAFRRVFFQVGAFSFFINILMLAPAVYMMQVYDRVLASRNELTLLFLTLLVLGLYALMGALEWVRSRVLVRVGTQLDVMLHERVFNAAFLGNKQGAGRNPAQAMQDLTSIRQFVAGNGVLAFFDAPWIPIFIGVIALIHPLLGAFSLFAAVVMFVLALLNEIYTRPPLNEANNQFSAANLYANNNLRHAEVIEAMGMLAGIRARWLERHRKFLALQSLASDRAAVISSITKAVRLAFQSLVLGLAAWFAIDGLISPGALIGAMVLMSRTLAPVEQLIGTWRQWIGARSSYVRTKELLDTFPAPPVPMRLPAPLGAIAVENAAVIPPGSKVPVLKGLNFAIPAGEVVCVIGPSGAGKSSLARLLAGIWAPAAGHARLDGADISAWDKRELGPYLGYLPQDIELFDGSVADNIARFSAVDSERVVTAARAAGVHDLILHLPQGYDTPIGVDGSILSGGQRQRIALARALYGEPVLLVLDEPNSNLDDAGEAALLQAIQKLKAQGKTVVLVSHRTGMLPVVDRLLVLREGGISAYGPRDQVLAQLKGGTQVVRGDRQTVQEQSER
jgi:ATP-binding cassette subfamily C exporter for protease/lipase